MAKHQCPNRFAGEGARGGCYFEIEAGDAEGIVRLDVGWSCVVVHRKEIPVTWLSEVIAIATGHKGGIAGFLAEHNYGGGYAMECDPAPAVPSDQHKRNGPADYADAGRGSVAADQLAEANAPATSFPSKEL